MSIPDAEECCMEGLDNDDAALKMACEDTSETTDPSWDGATCTSFTMSTIDGVMQAPVLNTLDAGACCLAGTEGMGDGNLLTACENNQGFVNVVTDAGPPQINRCDRYESVENVDGSFTVMIE